MATPPVRGSLHLRPLSHLEPVPQLPSSVSSSPDPTDYLEGSGTPESVTPRDSQDDGKVCSGSVKSQKSGKSQKSCKSAKQKNKRTSFKHMLKKRNKKPTLTDIFLDPEANDSLYTCHATDMLPKPKHYKVRRWKNQKKHQASTHGDTETDTYYDSLEMQSDLRKYYVGSRGSTNTTNTRLRYPVGTGATILASAPATLEDKSSKNSNSPPDTWASSSWRPAVRNGRSESLSSEELPQLVVTPERETFMQRLRHRFRA